MHLAVLRPVLGEAFLVPAEAAPKHWRAQRRELEEEKNEAARRRRRTEEQEKNQALNLGNRNCLAQDNMKVTEYNPLEN